MPKKGYDNAKEDRIRKVLEKTKNEGIWIRELARQAKIPYSTVYFYLNHSMKNEVEIKDINLGGSKIGKFKIVKLGGHKG